MSKVTCNGYSTNRNNFTESTKQTIIDHLSFLREQFKSKYSNEIGRQGSLETKWRFNNDENVIATLETILTEEEFLDDPVNWIMDSLKNCAERDYYYSYEKMWE